MTDDGRGGGGKTPVVLQFAKKLQTNFKKLKIIEKKKRNKRRNLFKTTQEISN
jgi:tetraacyldisaccharide-1-P 4'-kinase